MLRRTATLFTGLLIAGIMVIASAHQVQADAPMTPFRVTPVSPVPPAAPADGVDASTVLVLTSRDNGSAFTVPLGTLIFVRIPVYGQMRLNFDPSILQLITTPLPIPDDGFIDPAETPIPAGGPFPLYDGWRLRAIGPGTTALSVVNQPCPPGVMCPMIAFIDFSVTIHVEGYGYPPVTPYPPYPPIPPSAGNDIYIGTAYLNQTVSVQPGQILTLDLPFLAVGQNVDLQFDPAILEPLFASYPRYGEGSADSTYSVPANGWRFRVLSAGTTVLQVWDGNCQGSDLDCKSPLLFNVTLQASTNAR